MQFIIVEHTAVKIVYDTDEADGRVLTHEGINHVAGLVFRYHIAEETGRLGRSHHTLRGIVEIKIHQIAASLRHTRLLFAEWDKQILHQTPVKKCTDAIDRLHIKVSKLPYRSGRTLGGGHRAILRIGIYENIQGIALFERLADITGRKENLRSML